MSQTVKENVRRYYDYTMNWYRVFWHGDSNGIHYGLWDPDTKNLKDAIINMNRELAEYGNVTSKDYILDAGCGVGGSTLWLARQYGSRVLGITISNRQLAKAKQLASETRLTHLVEFRNEDFSHTSFSDNSFDVVWAIESVCHAPEKTGFLREAYRILKPGGRILIADGFLGRSPRNTIEHTSLNIFLKGWALPNLAEVKEFQHALQKVGFSNTVISDKTKQVMPTAHHMYRMAWWGYPVSKITTALGVTDKLITENISSGLVQRDLLGSGLMKYCFARATKL